MEHNRLHLRLVNTALELSGFDPRKVDGYLIARKLVEETGSVESFIGTLTHERICREVAYQFLDSIPEGESIKDRPVTGCKCPSCVRAREETREHLARSTRRSFLDAVYRAGSGDPRL